MKKILLLPMLFLATAAMFTSCGKYDPTANESSVIKPITEIEVIPQEYSAKLGSEWGDTISSSEASTRTARFTTLAPLWTLNFRLNNANCATVTSVSGATTTGLFHAKNGGMMVFPMDDYGEIVDTMGFEANSTGGVAISLENAIAKMDTLYMPSADHPECTLFGNDFIDDIVAQDNADGLIISNGCKPLEGDDYTEIVVSAYGSEMGATIYGSNGGKMCGHFAAGHASPHGWIDAHFVPCDKYGLMTWIVFGGG